MKKLLLLALTVTAAASLTACGGGSVKEIDELMENLVGTEEVAASYNVKYSAYGYSNIREFDVDGNVYNYLNTWSSSSDTTPTQYNNFYELTFNATNTALNSYDYYSGNNADPVVYTKTNVDLTVSGTSAGNRIDEVSVNPFLSLEALMQKEDSKFEMKSKYFTLDEEAETYYFVDPALESEFADLITVKTSVMTIKFNYNDKEELTNVELTYLGSEWTFSNFGNVTLTLPTVTPAA